MRDLDDVVSDELKVICDKLRERGLFDQALWLEQPGAVRELLSHDPHVRYDDGEEISECPQCGTQTATHGRESFPSGGPTRRYCRVAEAWRALGDPRGAADIERAHEEALVHNRVRGRPIDREALLQRFEMREPRLWRTEEVTLGPAPHLLPARCLRQIAYTPANGLYRLCALAGGHPGDCVPGTAVYERTASRLWGVDSTRTPEDDFASAVEAMRKL